MLNNDQSSPLSTNLRFATFQAHISLKWLLELKKIVHIKVVEKKILCIQAKYLGLF